MFDEKLLAPLIEEELNEANKAHPPFASMHEGYAVLKEEIEETKEVLDCIKSDLDMLWFGVKHDVDVSRFAETIYEKSIWLMAEAAQVGAMAKKFLNINKC